MSGSTSAAKTLAEQSPSASKPSELQELEAKHAQETARSLRRERASSALSATERRLERIGELPIPLSLDRACKRALDFVGALTLGLVFLPLMLGIVAFSWRGREPIVFVHKRVGRNGKIFSCFKFRTMVPNAEQALRDLLAADPARREEWVRDQKLRDDPRVTRTGKFLRATSLDELPQIWNVLKGEMSLVGPRPVTREELLRYGRNVVMYLMVKPGITGLWQVSGRNNVEYRRRVAIDAWYVRNQGILLDVWILLKTTMVVVRRRDAY